jgi:hypothetical protein
MKKNWEVMSVLLVRYDEWRATLSPQMFRSAQTGIIDIAEAKVFSNNFKTSRIASPNYRTELQSCKHKN